ncbi:MAG TPA: prepilin-type N-terminal cleavage/methylation domain-containing protein [Opitutaceae bacterium]
MPSATPARPRRASSAAGFTLVELMVTTTIIGLVVAGTLAFFVRTLGIYHYDAGKLLVNRDLRAFTSEMTDNATYANFFQIYPDFATRTVTDAGTGVTVDASVDDSESGDFLLLVYRDPDDDTKTNRLVGYYRTRASSADPASEGPVRKFDIQISPSSSAAVWTLLPAVSTANSWPEVIERSRGLTDGRLFYNFYDRSVMVKGQLFHRGNLTKRAANSYNFTVSPRG